MTRSCSTPPRGNSNSTLSAAPSLPPSWQIGRGLEGVASLAAEWDGLARAETRGLTANPLWTVCYWRAFGSPEAELVIHGLRLHERLVAVLPLVAGGRLLREWSAPANPHTPYWSFAFDERRPEAAGLILDRLLSSADLVHFPRLPARGGPCAALLAAAAERKLPVAVHEYPGDAYVDLSDGALWGRSAWKGAGRRRRQLQRLGRLAFEVVTCPETLAPALDECFVLESRGWKGMRGSPIRSRPDTLRFYTELAVASAGAGRLALYTLRLDGRLVAFEYCLRAQRRVDMLKLSFDPSLSKYSPGNVLRYFILGHERKAGDVDTYHLGLPSKWKLSWATGVDPLCRLRIYGPGVKARLAYQLGPRLRGWLKQRSPLRRLLGSKTGPRAAARADS